MYLFYNFFVFMWFKWRWLYIASLSIAVFILLILFIIWCNSFQWLRTIWYSFSLHYNGTRFDCVNATSFSVIQEDMYSKHTYVYIVVDCQYMYVCSFLSSITSWEYPLCITSTVRFKQSVLSKWLLALIFLAQNAVVCQ